MKYYDIGLERKILAILCHSPEIMQEVSTREDIGKGLFSDITNQVIFESAYDFYRINSTLPNENVFKKFIIKYINIDKRSKISKNKLIDRYEIVIDRLYNGIKLGNMDYDQFDAMIIELTKLKKGRELQKTIISLSDELDEGDVNKAEEVLIKFRMDVLSNASISNGGLYVDDWKERALLIKKKKEHPESFSAIPVRIMGWNPDDPFNDEKPVALDKFLDGGSFKGELTLIIGDSGAGKSMELLEFAYCAAVNNRNAIYFSIEMSKMKIETRLDSKVSGIPYSKFRTGSINKKEFTKWKESVQKFKEKFGKLYVEGFYKGCTIQAIESRAKDIEQELGEKIDIIVIDYLNDISPIRSTGDKWSDQGEVSWEMKLLAGSWNKGEGIPVITANQGKSSSALSKFKKMANGMVYFKRMLWNDAAFSPLPSQHASVIIGLLNSSYHDNMIATMVNHQIVKNRDGEVSIGIVSFPNFSLCRMNSRIKYINARENYEKNSGSIVENTETTEVF